MKEEHNHVDQKDINHIRRKNKNKNQREMCGSVAKFAKIESSSLILFNFAIIFWMKMGLETCVNI